MSVFFTFLFCCCHCFFHFSLFCYLLPETEFFIDFGVLKELYSPISSLVLFIYVPFLLVFPFLFLYITHLIICHSRPSDCLASACLSHMRQREPNSRPMLVHIDLDSPRSGCNVRALWVLQETSRALGTILSLAARTTINFFLRFFPPLLHFFSIPLLSYSATCIFIY